MGIVNKLVRGNVDFAFTQKNFKVHSKASLLTLNFSDLNKYRSFKHQRKILPFSPSSSSLLAYVVAFVVISPEKAT